MKDILLDLQRSNEFCCIYGNENDTSSFIFGKVLSFDEKFALLSLVDTNGNNDGFLLKQIDSIYRVDTADRYTCNMKRRMSAACYSEQCCEIGGNDLLFSFLSYAKSKKTIVSLELNDSGLDDVVGIIEQLSDSICCINVLNEWAEPDGIAHVMLKSITQACCGSSDEKKIEMLL